MNTHYCGVSALCRLTVLALSLLAGACAEFGLTPAAPPVVVEPAPLPTPPVVAIPDALPPLDVVMVAHHQQCAAPSSQAASEDSSPQLRDLMQWLKRSCAPSDALLAPQLARLKQLRQRYTWPEAYAGWLDEWCRLLKRMQALQQRAATAEAAQATMVQRLRAIESDLTTRP